MSLTDDRTPVLIQGIKKETIGLKKGQKAKDLINALKENGSKVSQSATDISETEVEENLEDQKERLEDNTSQSGQKTRGLIEIVVKDTGAPVKIPSNREITSSGEIDFATTGSKTIPSGESRTFEVVAKESGAAGNESFADIRTVLALEQKIDHIKTKSVRNSGGNLGITQQGQDPKSEDLLDELESRDARNKIDKLQDKKQKKEDNIEQLSKQGILGEGNFTVQLLYDQPNISVSAKTRFVEHETVDGAIIRQKLGKGNTGVEMEGVCTTPEANLLDNLFNEDRIFIKSNRFTGNVTVESTSTNPIEDGGGMNLDGNFTHEFTVSMIQVEAQ